MRNDLLRCIRLRCLTNVVYLDSKGNTTKRKVRIIKLDGDNVRVYCYLRRSTRIFKIDNILAAVPIIKKERMVI